MRAAENLGRFRTPATNIGSVQIHAQGMPLLTS